MVSDHVAITPDVAEQYPAPFYDPFTTLAWLAGITNKLWLGTTVLVLPYRHPLLVARMAANLNEFSGGRLILGVGAGWARQEFGALDVPFDQRGALTEEYIRVIREAWREDAGYRGGPVPLWIGGNSQAAIRRAIKLGDAWHPLRFTLPWLRSAVSRHAVPMLAPRIMLRLSDSPAAAPGRLAGVGTVEQVMGDLDELRLLGADTVVLDPYSGDPAETSRPQEAWRALAAVAAHWKRAA
jgi:alkanesulfonate monooxygenase SsuD/methylene tetrahydromethanopterin reductase-like flavin-dependent oxidoreductase (luciferase family)